MELEFVEWLRSRFPPHPCLRLGIGDDAAVIDWPAGQGCVTTVDLLTEGIDFRLSGASPRDIGRKALAVSLSDLAAMAAKPVAALIALALPRANAGKLAVEIYEGLLPLAEQFNVAIAGGDTNTWDGPLVISTTLFGTPTGAGPLRRDGARPGDAILVTGALGGSILEHHLHFEPRVAEAIALHEGFKIHAAMDISDGLTLDLARLCAASGVGAVLNFDAIPISNDAIALEASQPTKGSPLDHALSDGEDFELLFAASPEIAERLIQRPPFETRLSIIGQFTKEKGMWQGAISDSTRITPRGYQH